MIVVFFIFFAQDITYATIIMIIIGACVGSLWVAGALILSDVVDEIALKNKKRKEGIYYGFVNFFGRLEIVIQSLVFTAIHILFGFEAGAPTQNALAILGLRIQIAIFPMIFMLLGGLIFWKWYDLTPEHSKKIQEQLQELNL
jgi:Na+/melibiose symporter-like transporter